MTAWGLNNPSLGYTLTNAPANLTNATVISAQALHSLALRSDGTVVGWGYNTAFGEAEVPSGLSNVVAISAGYQHNLAVFSNSTVTAWGNDNSGQCEVPTGLSNVVQAAAGLHHSVALLRDGTVIAWGRNTYGETNVPAGLTNVVAIAAGGDPFNDSSYSLALREDGTVVRWGSGEVLAGLGGLSNVIAMASGGDHALAVRTGPRTPVITLAPTHQYQVSGGSVTFSSRGAGLYGVRYQWQYNGVNSTGATNAALTLANVQASHQGQYNVVVSNEEGSIPSSNATLYLVTAPVVLSQTPLPTNQTVIFHKDLTLSVTATALGENDGFPLTYQWQLNGTNINGANTSSYTLFGGTTTTGTYAVIASNAAGSSSASWQVAMTYTGSYIAPGTLAYHLSTNAVGYANGHSPADEMQLSGWTYGFYSGASMGLLTNSVWSTNFWLRGVQGLSATSIGISNNISDGIQYYGSALMVTMVSPRHYLRANHIDTPSGLIAFLDTNNVIYWRTYVQQVQIGASDTAVGIINEDLPLSVGYLPVLDTNYAAHLPTNELDYVQAIGMNQDMKVFSQPILLQSPSINWRITNSPPFGLATNWNIGLRGGDSSDPERLLIGNQFVLVSQHYHAIDGPNVISQFDAINQNMHYLSTNNNVVPDYQLTPFSLTNWPSIQ